MKPRFFKTLTTNISKTAKSAAALLLSAAFALSLSSCLNDRETGGEEPGENKKVTIAFNPVSEGVAVVNTRAAGDEYHGDPDDPELKDPTYDGPNNDPNIAAGRLEDVKISHLRVLLYDSYSGRLAENGNFDTPVNAQKPLPVTATVLTGLYDVVFIVNEKSDTQSGGDYLTEFLADEENYNILRKLENALIHRTAFDSTSDPARDIPMYQVVRNVWIKGPNDLQVDGVSQGNPWSPTITRAGVRLSLAITLRPDQYSSWTPQEVKIGGITPSSHLVPGQTNPWPANENGFASITVPAATGGSSPGVIEFYKNGVKVANTGSGSYDEVLVRYDRIILPEHRFDPRGDSEKALVLSMPINGNDMKGLVSVENPGTAIEGYTLPRNTWLHLGVTVASTRLNVYPEVVNWDGQGIDGGDPGDDYGIKAPTPFILFGWNRPQTFTATTSHSTGNIELVTAGGGAVKIDYIDGNGWISSVAAGATNGSGTDRKSVVTVTAAANTSGARRSADIYLTVGDASMKVRLVQEPAMVFAAPGMLGIKKSDYERQRNTRDHLEAEYLGAGDAPAVAKSRAAAYFDPDIRLTIKGSSTYSAANQGDNALVENAAVNEGLGGLENEPVYALYFKWGSTIAMLGGENDAWSADDVVWVNPEFAAAHPGHDFGHPVGSFSRAVSEGAPRTGNNVKKNLPEGHGDPCDFAGGGTAARPSGWKTPTGEPWRTNTTYGGTIHPFGQSQGDITPYLISDIYNGVSRWAVASPDRSIFLPVTGMRNTSQGGGSGDVSGMHIGHYWSSTDINDNTQASDLSFNVDTDRINPANKPAHGHGFPVRCVPPKPIAYAAPGVIGYIADGPRKGELTLRGSKEFAGTPVVGPGGRALATGLPLETETVHAAYFKWGSLVALSSETTDIAASSSWFDAADVIAAPRERGGVEAVRSAIGSQTNATAWANNAAIPFRHHGGTGAHDPALGWEADPANGYGDPCQYYFGGDWFVPSGGLPDAGWYSEGGAPFGTTNPGNWSGIPAGGGWKDAGDDNLPISGAVGGRNGVADWSMFLSATLCRYVDGSVFHSRNFGNYWASGYWPNPGDVTQGQALFFGRTDDEFPIMNPLNVHYVSYGIPIRCVETPGVRVPRGVIGYYKDGPRAGELTLEGDKTYFATGEADQNAHTVYAAYFKFGSLVAFDSSDNGPFTQNDIVKVPKEWGSGYPTYGDGLNALKDQVRGKTAENGWAQIPVMTTDIPTTIPSTHGGISTGDPCAYWFGVRYAGPGLVGGGYKGGRWRLPAEYENVYFVGAVGSGPKGRHDVSSGYYTYTPPGTDPLHKELGFGHFPQHPSGTANGVRLPIAGDRLGADGRFNRSNSGAYWSSSGSSFVLTDSYVFTTQRTMDSDPARHQNFGLAVRCMQDPWGGYADILYFEGTGDGTKLAVGKYGPGKAITAANYKQTLAYFKLGSLVGFTNDGSTFDHTDIRFNPTQTATTAFNAYASIPMYNATVVNYEPLVSSPAYHNDANLSAGRGDPCKLAGLTVAEARQRAAAGTLDEYDSGWRLPTARENVNFIGGPTDGTAGAKAWITWKPGDAEFTFTHGTANSNTTWNYVLSTGTPHTYGFPLVANAYSAARSEVLPGNGYRNAVTSGNMIWPNQIDVMASTPQSSTMGYESEIGYRPSTVYNLYPGSNLGIGHGVNIRCVRDDQNPNSPKFRGHPAP